MSNSSSPSATYICEASSTAAWLPMATAISRGRPSAFAFRPRIARWWLAAMPAMSRAPPSSRSLAIETLRRPVSGFLAMMTPAVM